MKNKNIIITGGLGFIGSHIADELIEDNNVCLLYTSPSPRDA